MLGRQSGYTHVTRCNDGSFCCGDSNAACCNSYSGVYLNENGTEILQSSESGPLPDTTTSSTDVPYSSPIPTSLQTRVLTSTGTSTTNLPSQTATATNAPSADQSEEGLSTEAKNWNRCRCTCCSPCGSYAVEAMPAEETLISVADSAITDCLKKQRRRQWDYE